MKTINNPEYRVKKVSDTEYHIQIKTIKKTGFLFWYKDKINWCNVNTLGEPFKHGKPMLKHFNTLEKALKQIGLFKYKNSLKIN